VKLTDRKRAEIVRLRRSGLALREIARRVGCSHTVVSKWLARAEPEPEPEPDPVTAVTDIAPDDPIAFLERSMRESYELAQEAKAVGNHTASQKCMRDITNFSAVLARMRTQANADADADAERYSKKEIEDAFDSVRERVAAALDRPLLCAQCSRALSASFGGYSADAVAKAMAEGH
jgi:hypothetical protein